MDATDISSATLSELPTFRLYRLADVRAALGAAAPDFEDDGDQANLDQREPITATEQGTLVAAILARGEAGCWRRLAYPTLEVIEAVAALGVQAPHMAELIDLALSHLQGQHVLGLPTLLPPILLVGPPGAGKTWVCRRLAECLSVPFRSFAMNSSTLSESLTGSHGSWKNAGPGLIARTLLQESVANPVLFIDELDKAHAHGWNSDPFRPFYTALEAENARHLHDDHLQFGMDASAVSYLMSANAEDGLPTAIVDRLTILHVPDMDDEQRGTVARAIFADLNQAMGRHFERIDDRALDALARCHPRKARASLIDAMMRAAAAGRRSVVADDLRIARPRPHRRIGF